MVLNAESPGCYCPLPPFCHHCRNKTFQHNILEFTKTLLDLYVYPKLYLHVTNRAPLYYWPDLHNLASTHAAMETQTAMVCSSVLVPGRNVRGGKGSDEAFKAGGEGGGRRG